MSSIRSGRIRLREETTVRHNIVKWEPESLALLGMLWLIYFILIPTTTMEKLQQHTFVRKTSIWLAFTFYFLIAFEFFYMVSPFAMYFYSVYGPGMHLLEGNGATGWLNMTFLPHIVSETRSSLLNGLRDIGFFLFSIGGGGFILGAGQIYLAKLRKKPLVSVGLYRYARHPQYASLIICGLGMLLIWPRYLVLISYITMLFVYILLGRFEERECLRQYGEKYQAYHAETPMFFPFTPSPGKRMSECNLPLPLKIALAMVAYACLIGTAVLGAGQVRNWSLDQLYVVYDADSVTLSVVRLEENKMTELLELAKSNQSVRQLLHNNPDTDKYINYITPMDWHASEIPMRPVEGAEHFHYQQRQDSELHKIIITKALLIDPNTEGKKILTSTIRRIPVAEVVVDFSRKNIMEVLGPAEPNLLSTVPLPIF